MKFGCRGIRPVVELVFLEMERSERTRNEEGWQTVVGEQDIRAYVE